MQANFGITVMPSSYMRKNNTAHKSLKHKKGITHSTSSPFTKSQRQKGPIYM